MKPRLALLICFSVAHASFAVEPPISVVVYSQTETAKGPMNLKRILTAERGFEVRSAPPDAFANNALSGADVVILPGGSGSKQSKSLGEEGREAIQRFVDGGGGYVGICAGAYLASAEYDWSLHLINTRVLDRKHWARGSGLVTLSLAPAAAEVLGVEGDRAEVQYAQGPLLAAAIDPELPPYRPIALFETEIAKKGAPEGVMVGTTAIATGDFGAGRVLCFSPHPEKSAGPHEFIEAGVRWAAGR